MATPEKTHGYTIKYDSTVVGDIDAGIANATNCYITIKKIPLYHQLSIIGLWLMQLRYQNYQQY